MATVCEVTVMNQHSVELVLELELQRLFSLLLVEEVVEVELQGVRDVLLDFDSIVGKPFELNYEVERSMLYRCPFDRSTQLRTIWALVQVVSIEDFFLEETLQTFVERLLLLDLQIQVEELLLSARGIVAVHAFNLAEICSSKKPRN